MRDSVSRFEYYALRLLLAGWLLGLVMVINEGMEREAFMLTLMLWCLVGAVSVAVILVIDTLWGKALETPLAAIERKFTLLKQVMIGKHQ